jgi:hypothetical protein
VRGVVVCQRAGADLDVDHRFDRGVHHCVASPVDDAGRRHDDHGGLCAANLTGAEEGEAEEGEQERQTTCGVGESVGHG